MTSALSLSNETSPSSPSVMFKLLIIDPGLVLLWINSFNKAASWARVSAFGFSSSLNGSQIGEVSSIPNFLASSVFVYQNSLSWFPQISLNITIFPLLTVPQSQSKLRARKLPHRGHHNLLRHSDKFPDSRWSGI